jgi:transposase
MAGVAEGSEEPAAGRRRRRWSLEEKRRIVAESRAPGASASLVARRHDVNTNMLFTWRRQFAADEADARQPVSFVPATITADPPGAPCSGGGERIEIVLASGARVIVGTGVDESTLARVIKVLSRQR